MLGSRYVEGGGTRNWGLVRRFISRGGSLYAQVLLQLGIRDLTGGFKCYRRRVLETIDLDAIDSRGYAFQIETTYRAIRAGFSVVEVPITFADREVGGSKMSKRDRAGGDLEGPGPPPPRSGRPPGTATQTVREITDETFEARCSRPSKPVVVDFWAPWCGPCKAVEPILEDLAEEHADRVEFAKLNIDENPLVASRFGVLAIPTAILFEGGEAQGDRRRRPLTLPLRGRVGAVARPYVVDDSVTLGCGRMPSRSLELNRLRVGPRRFIRGSSKQ